MSSTVSVEPSTSPTPSHKVNVNGGVNQRLNLSSSSVLKHNSVITPLSRTTPTTVLTPPGGVIGLPSCGSGPGNIANVTTNSTATTKPLLDVSRASTHPGTVTPLDASRAFQLSKLTSNDNGGGKKDTHGIYQMLASLALLCVLSLLMSFLALFFLQKLGPMTTAAESIEKDKSISTSKIVMSSDEYVTVYQVSVALSTLTIALDLCCLFVCCIQFLFAIKLLKTPQGNSRTHKFLKRSSHTRVLAIGGFFLSIPVFFTGVILFTFIHFSEVPAIATSVVIGIGIVFCGVASVQNVYLWQWEKTRACQELAESRISQLRDSGAISPEAAAHAIELSTLV